MVLYKRKILYISIQESTNKDLHKSISWKGSPQLRSNIRVGCMYHLSRVSLVGIFLYVYVYSLWAPVANSAILPGRLPFPGTSRNKRSNSCMCAGGTISSRDPLSMRIGVVNGILVNFDAESHFWWHRKETGESQGIAVGIRRGRERNVFSRINARIYTRVY